MKLSKSTRWTHGTGTHSVELLHRLVGSDTEYEKNHWCLYAYIFPNHPLYAEFPTEEQYTETTKRFGLHGGCTYLTVDKNGVKIGCDYNHLQDDRFWDLAEPNAELLGDMEKLNTFLVRTRQEKIIAD